MLNIFCIYSKYVSERITLMSFSFYFHSLKHIEKKMNEEATLPPHALNPLLQTLFDIFTFVNYFHNALAYDKDFRYQTQSLLKVFTCVFTIWSTGLCPLVHMNTHHCFGC